MIMCSNCKKRPAVVFITSVKGNEKKNEGLCFACARERKIPQVTEYMEQLGISEEEVDHLSDQMMEMLDGDSFEMGGSGLMPDFLSNISNLLGGVAGNEPVSAEAEPPEEEKSRESSGKGLFGRSKDKDKDKKKKEKGASLPRQLLHQSFKESG